MEMMFDWRRLRWWCQRRTRGFDARELWSLDISLAKHILPRLEAFRRTVTEQARGDILDEMIFAMNEVATTDTRVGYRDNKYYPGIAKRTQKGLKLFGKHFRCLWT